jgi:hypothetical protein
MLALKGGDNLCQVRLDVQTPMFGGDSWQVLGRYQVVGSYDGNPVRLSLLAL